jgi:hypothetical protein
VLNTGAGNSLSAINEVREEISFPDFSLLQNMFSDTMILKKSAYFCVTFNLPYQSVGG